MGYVTTDQISSQALPVEGFLNVFSPILKCLQLRVLVACQLRLEGTHQNRLEERHQVSVPHVRRIFTGGQSFVRLPLFSSL